MLAGIAEVVVRVVGVVGTVGVVLALVGCSDVDGDDPTTAAAAATAGPTDGDDATSAPTSSPAPTASADASATSGGGTDRSDGGAATDAGPDEGVNADAESSAVGRRDGERGADPTDDDGTADEGASTDGRAAGGSARGELEIGGEAVEITTTCLDDDRLVVLFADEAGISISSYDDRAPTMTVGAEGYVSEADEVRTDFSSAGLRSYRGLFPDDQEPVAVTVPAEPEPCPFD